MDSIKRQARFAGLLYFVSGIPAPFGLLYVPGKLVVPGDPTATADHIRASETLLRCGIAAELVSATMFVFVTLALYRLFKGFDQGHARAMVILYALSVPISFLNVLNYIAALFLVRGAPFLSGFDQRQLDTLAFLFIRLHGQGLIMAQVFWGLWLFPFGILVIRSGFIPRLLGAWLIVNGSAYVAMSLSAILVPHYAGMVSRIGYPFLLGELAVALWLLIMGAKELQSGLPAAQPAGFAT
jgi:hypothetical protein